MTPRELARTECANFVSDGGCLGIQVEDLADHEQTKRAAPLERCLLANKPMKPCRYFEQVILPLADYPSPKDKPRLQAERLAARETYLLTCRKPVPTHTLRLCECGEPLAARQRVCSKCSRKRRLQTNRASQRKRRQLAGMSVSS